MATRTATRKTLFSLLGIFIFSASFFVSFVHKTEASLWDPLGFYDVDMGNVFLGADPNNRCIGGTYLVDQNYLRINRVTDSNIAKDSVYLQGIIAIHADNLPSTICGSVTAATDKDGDNIVEKVDQFGYLMDETGDWGTILSKQGKDIPLYRDNDTGLFLRIGTTVSVNGQVLSGDSDAFDQYGILKTPPQNNDSDLTFVNNYVDFSLTGLPADAKDYNFEKNKNITSLLLQNPKQNLYGNQQPPSLDLGVTGLLANTTYYAQLFILEDDSTDAAYSMPVRFKTLSTDSTVVAQSSTQEEALGETSNPSILRDLECGGFGFGGNFSNCLVIAMYYIIYVPSAWILAGTGYLFNAFSLLSISSYMYSNASFITEGWKTIRDLMNMFFIFALLYAAIRIIISKDSAGSIAPLIKNIIITAILINFSLFIVKIGIDASNITARIFYNAIGVTVTSGNTDTITNQAVIGTPEVNISQGIVAGFGIQRVASTKQLDAINNSGHNTSLVAILLIFGIIINLVAAGVFFTVGALFVGRIVGFYMAMLFAPLAFMSDLIPMLGKIPQLNSSGWRENLMKDILLAPLFLFFIWIILGLANTDFLEKMAQNTSGDWVKMLVMIALEAMVILSMLVAAKKLAASQASFFGGQINAVLSKGLNFVTGAAVGAATGGVALAGRGFIGKSFAGMADSEKLKERAKQGGAGGWLARQQLKTYTGISKSSFDARKTVAGNAFEKQTGIPIDNKNLNMIGLGTESGIGGYVGDKKRRQDKIIAEAKLMDASDSEVKNITAKLDATRAGVELRAAERDTERKFKNFAELESKKDYAKLSTPEIDALLKKFKDEKKDEFDKALKTYIDDKDTPANDPEAGYYKKYNGKSKDQITRERRNAYADTLEKSRFYPGVQAVGNVTTGGAAITGAAIAASTAGSIAAAPIAGIAGSARISRDAELGAAGALRRETGTTEKLDKQISDVDKQIKDLVNGLKGSKLTNSAGISLTNIDPDFDITKARNKHNKVEMDTKEAIDRALEELEVHRASYETQKRAADIKLNANPDDTALQLEYTKAVNELNNINKHMKKMEDAVETHAKLQERRDTLNEKKRNLGKGDKKDDKKDKDKDDKK